MLQARDPIGLQEAGAQSMTPQRERTQELAQQDPTPEEGARLAAMELGAVEADVQDIRRHPPMLSDDTLTGLANGLAYQDAVDRGLISGTDGQSQVRSSAAYGEVESVLGSEEAGRWFEFGRELRSRQIAGDRFIEAVVSMADLAGEFGSWILQVRFARSQAFSGTARRGAAALQGSMTTIREDVAIAREAAALRGACFPSGTLVHAADGLRPIEDIGVGDVVWSYSETERRLVGRRVRRVFVRDAPHLLVLTLAVRSGSDIIRVTPDHPFLTRLGGELIWVRAGELAVGDSVATVGAEFAVVSSVADAGGGTVYNIEVEDTHTYAVGRVGAVVHNQCRPTLRAVRALRDLGFDASQRRAFFEGRAVMLETSVGTGSDAQRIIAFYQRSGTTMHAVLFSVYNATGEVGTATGGFARFRSVARTLARATGATDLNLYGIAILNEDINRMLPELGFSPTVVPVPPELGGGTVDGFVRRFPVRGAE